MTTPTQPLSEIRVQIGNTFVTTFQASPFVAKAFLKLVMAFLVKLDRIKYKPDYQI